LQLVLLEDGVVRHGRDGSGGSRNISRPLPLGVEVASSQEILERARTIAVVGASRDPNKAGGSVPEGLQRRGFRIIPINPYADTLFGEHVYRSLLDVPEKIDLVDVFRPAADAPEIARQAVTVGAKALWLQLDIRSAEARRIAEGAGLDYVENECTAVVSSLYRIRKPTAA
jgi:predicted CoA-binding protein